MTKEKRKYSNEVLQEHLLDLIPTSPNQYFVIETLLSRLDLVKASKEYKATEKTINRILTKWADKFEHELIKERVGRENRFYWMNEEFRNSHFSRFSNLEMAESQAVAFYLLQTHLADALPPKFKRELESRFEIAKNEVLDNSEWLNIAEDWKDKISVEPLGFKLHEVSTSDKEYDAIFDALEKQQVLKASYNSIHDELNEKGEMVSSESFQDIIFSPQQIRLQNLQLSVLVLIHEAGKKPFFKSLVLARLKNVEVYEGDITYIRNQQKMFNETLVLKTHTGMKNYFEQAKLSTTQEVTHIEGDTWQIEAKIELPQHFKHDGQDFFYLCNLLSSYANAVEVVSPDYIRDEMKRRSDLLYQAYQTGPENNDVINGFNAKVLKPETASIKDED
jgi:hypothetical protein